MEQASGGRRNSIETPVLWTKAYELSSKPYRAVPSFDRLMAQHAKTFTFATYFLPTPSRLHTITLYAFFRTLDDLVDAQPLDQSARQAAQEELAAWRSWFQTSPRRIAPREPLGSMLDTLIQQYALPVAPFLDFLDGLEYDLGPVFPPSFAALRKYCYQVAGTVGIIMACVLGARSAVALQAAEHLGIAMQLTNILRDLGEDLRHNRIYLPQDELHRFGLDPVTIRSWAVSGQGPDDRLRALLQFHRVRAESYYLLGLRGVSYLPLRLRFAIVLAARLYRRILDRIEARGYDTLRGRAATSFDEKLSEALIVAVRMLWEHVRNRYMGGYQR